MSKYLSARDSKSCELSVKVVPGASKTSFAGLYGDEAIKIRIAAPPVDGAANEALVEFLAKAFSLAKSDVQIRRGGASKHKQILLGLALERAQSILSKHLGAD